MSERLYGEEIRRLAEIIRTAGRTVVLTGAGISTASGIPDFRGPAGFWKSEEIVKLLSLETLYNKPEVFYSKSITLLSGMRDKKPNQAHLGVARLEEMGLVKAVITQNIDGLHLHAGSRNVYEIHGNLREAHCQVCYSRYPFEFLLEEAAFGRIPPRCRECGGVVRPDVVFFDDPMPQEFYLAYEEAENADLMLVIGSSLQVYPAAYLPGLVKKLAIVNAEPTPYDERAEVVIHGRAEVVIPKLVREIESLTRRDEANDAKGEGAGAT